MLDKNLYVAQLDVGLQKKIKAELTSYFEKELELGYEDVKIELEMAMNSRLSDLENTIDINSINNKNKTSC